MVCPTQRLHAIGDRPEERGMDDVVAPEVEDAAEPGLLELQPRELAVAAVQDRMEQDEERAGDGSAGPRGRERARRPARPTPTLTRVIAFGVTASRRSRRLTASEIRRST